LLILVLLSQLLVLRGREQIQRRSLNRVFASWGTAAVPATAKTDTTLSTEVGNQTGTRVTGVSSIVTTTATNDTYQVVATLTAAAAISVTNSGLFDAASVGNLFLKGDFAAQALNIW